MSVLEVLGGSVAWHADTDPAAVAVLDRHWPAVPNHGDITAADWTAVESIDVLTAGYPCQPVSSAGEKRGTADERWIWPAVADALRALRPGLAVLENVADHLVRGFGDVLGDLADLGYDARWCRLPASGVGACHQRQRVIIAAAPADADGPRWPALPVGATPSWRPERHDAGRAGVSPTADPAGDGCARNARLGRGGAARRGGERVAAGGAGVGAVAWGRWAPAIQRWEHRTRPTPDPVEYGPRGGRRLNAAFSEWMMGLPAGWVTATPGLSREDQFRLIGNGLVPQQGAAALRWLLDVPAAVSA